jgi:L-seryl-tRNA(Ser) seleniumtransferase
MKNEVVVQKSHRHVYDHAIRMVGVRLVEIETIEELIGALSDRTAMFAFFGDAADRGRISLADMARIGKDNGVPTFVDAAAERPDVPNRYLAEGADVVAYSGGKCLRGPQSSGLVLGRKDLLKAAFMNGAPHHSIGRPMKAGKEEIIGLLAAVEMWMRRDHAAEWREWERRLDVIASCVASVPSLTTSVRQPGRSNVAPILDVRWDATAVGVTGEDVRRRLSDGEPRIELFTNESGVSVMPYMMEANDEVVVAERLREALCSTE